MTDFASQRAMLVDFGVDPRCIETMSLPQIREMMSALVERRNGQKMPTVAEEKKAMEVFREMVASDPSVRLN